MAKIIFKSAVFLSVLALGACSNGTHAIPVDPPFDVIESAIASNSDEPFIDRDACFPDKWWELFEDPQLNAIIEKTLLHNPTLQMAQAKILAAAYNADRVRSALYPYLGWGADVSRQKLSKTGVIPFATAPGAPIIDVPTVPGRDSRIPVYFTLYETEVNLKYTFDFWHKNCNTLRAALGEVQARIAEEAFSRLQLSTSVAEVYFELQSNYKIQEIAQGIVDNRQSYLNLIERRIKSNLDTALSLQLAQLNLSDAQDHLLEVQGAIAVSEYQLLAYMADDFNEELVKNDITKITLPRVPVPEDLHLNLISRRPDITAQLWVIKSAGLRIEVAKAGFYPDFNLSAFFGFQTIHFAELFKWPSRYFNVDPAVSLPIFDGGLLIADLNTSEVNYDLAILNYNDLVINAAKEVLTSLAVLKNSNQRLIEAEKKAANQEKLFELTTLRARHNLGNNLDELTIQGNYLRSQEQEIISLERTLQALLDLIKALGGGYEI